MMWNNCDKSLPGSGVVVLGFRPKVFQQVRLVKLSPHSVSAAGILAKWFDLVSGQYIDLSEITQWCPIPPVKP